MSEDDKFKDVDIPTAIKILARQEILVDHMSRLGDLLTLAIMPWVLLYLLDVTWHWYLIFPITVYLFNRLGKWIVRA